VLAQLSAACAELLPLLPVAAEAPDLPARWRQVWARLIRAPGGPRHPRPSSAPESFRPRPQEQEDEALARKLEVEAAAAAHAAGGDGGYRQRAEFGSSEEYGEYVRQTLQQGMRIRMLEDYDTVSAGDEGEYIGTNGGTPPCHGRWDSSGGYWVHWRMVEIIDPAAPAARRGVTVAGCTMARVNGNFAHAGTRNGRACYTHESGQGALYFDGTHWKLCQDGVGDSESGWNFSQEDARGDAGPLPPTGAWESSRATAEETRDYTGLTLAVQGGSGGAHSGHYRCDAHEYCMTDGRLGAAGCSARGGHRGSGCIICDASQHHWSCCGGAYDSACSAAAAPATAVAGGAGAYRTRGDFGGERAYMDYLRAHLRIGMRVRATEGERAGDVGTFHRDDGSDSPQFLWDAHGGAYYVTLSRLELLDYGQQPAGSRGPPPDALGAAAGPTATALRCPAGHPLADRGTSADNGWACDTRNEPGGCARGCTGFRQSAGWGRFQCGQGSSCPSEMVQPLIGLVIPR
jgi:hypothetical protein